LFQIVTALGEMHPAVAMDRHDRGLGIGARLRLLKPGVPTVIEPVR
jgi:hypothetical protein